MSYTLNICIRNSTLLLLILLFSNCKKLISIAPPVNTITTTQSFSNDNQALNVLTGIYSKLINNFQFSSGATTIYCGCSADEFIFFNQTNVEAVQFQNNTLQPTNPFITNLFWSPIYFTIYQTNAAITGIQGSNGIHPQIKNELLGEAKFLRAFSYFYLVNLFGNAPLVTSTNYNKTLSLSNETSTNIYKLIISDLLDAQTLLANDYSYGNGARVIPNKWAASALLSRVYLYLQRWNDAEVQATNVISNSAFYKLSPDLNSVFLTNSNEAIWQLQQSPDGYPFNATNEGYAIIPADNLSDPPNVYLTSQLLGSFEIGDQRKTAWIDSTNYQGIYYYYPYKYKVGPSQAKKGNPFTEYYMVLRLAEQYLIRAEAMAQQSKLPEAVNDLDSIRNRAGLSSLPSGLSQSQVLAAVIQERKVELFAEWGHRWLDLKRSGQSHNVLSVIQNKSGWKDYQILYPIPLSELQADPNLTQNTGY